MKLPALLASVALALSSLMADTAFAHESHYGHRYSQSHTHVGFVPYRSTHLRPQDLFRRHARVLTSEDPDFFRVLVVPNLVPRAAALVTAVGAGQHYCGRLGKTALKLKRVQRHADQDISAWSMDFRCR